MPSTRQPRRPLKSEGYGVAVNVQFALCAATQFKDTQRVDCAKQREVDHLQGRIFRRHRHFGSADQQPFVTQSAVDPRYGPLVLVVEDEPIIRMAAVALVQDLGYQVIEAADTLEAVRLFEQQTNIRIVFTDIDMPGGMSGEMLAEAIRDRWPPIEIILTSGNAIPNAELIPERGVFLPKPVLDRQLERVLNQFIPAGPPV